MNTNAPLQRVVYKNLPLRIILSIVSAHIIISFGEEESLFEMLLMRDYYLSMIGSTTIAFILVSIVHYVTLRLDLNYDWKESRLQRATLQVLLGLYMPSLVAFLLAFFYFKLYGIDIILTPHLRFDFPIIFLMLLILNIYYVTYYFYSRLNQVEQATLHVDSTVKEAVEEQATSTKASLLVNKGTRNIPLPLEQISYFYHEGEYNFVRSFEGEDFLIPYTLDQLQQSLSENEFFRVNRQMIVNYKACKHYEPLEYSKLKLEVQPPAKEPIIISQRRARPFREWINTWAV